MKVWININYRQRITWTSYKPPSIPLNPFSLLKLHESTCCKSIWVLSTDEVFDCKATNITQYNFVLYGLSRCKLNSKLDSFDEILIATSPTKHQLRYYAWHSFLDFQLMDFTKLFHSKVIKLGFFVWIYCNIELHKLKNKITKINVNVIYILS